MTNYSVDSSVNREEKDWDGLNKIWLEVYEDGFPRRHDTSFSITVAEAYDFIDQLQKTISEIEKGHPQ
jgi:hypothetical protein